MYYNLVNNDMKNKNDITGDLIKTKTDGQQAYANNWEKIFGKKKPEVKARKVQPKQSITQIHKDKSKRIPRHYKYNNTEE